DIVLHDLYVARVHCEIRIADQRAVVADLDSPGGTFVNSQKIKEQEIRLGDVVRIGNSHMRLDFLSQEDAEVVDVDAVEEDEAVDIVEVEAEQTSEERLAALEGQKLGHYEFGSLLGKGHHGMTYRARDIKTEQVVALKVLSPDFPANEGEMQPFVKTL